MNNRFNTNSHFINAVYFTAVPMLFYLLYFYFSISHRLVAF